MRRVLFLAFAVNACVPTVASAQSYALRGTLVTPTEVLASSVIGISGSTISSAGASDSAAAIDVDGVIFPGLIDLHDHITWNLLPRWKPGRVFSNRYEWQETAEYTERLDGPHRALDPYSCDMNRYGELKAIINGATATVGGVNAECIRGLARNLDFLSELSPNQLVGTEPFRNLVFPFQPATPCEEQAIRDIGKPLHDCSPYPNVSTEPAPRPRPKPPTLRAVIGHVAEGIDASARREFTFLEAHGFLVPGFSIIHGVALQPDHFARMHAAGVGLIWSPRSNLELYGRTTDVAAARAAGVLMAIAPDWSPTGSTGMLAELAYAERLRLSGPLAGVLSEKDLVEMATINPARLARLDDRIGRLAPGYAADLIVMRRRRVALDASGAAQPGDAHALAYRALLQQSPADLKLVVVGGTPVYGDPAIMKMLIPGPQLEETEAIQVCGESRIINVKAGTYQRTPWFATEARLRDALVAFRIPLAGFVECSAP